MMNNGAADHLRRQPHHLRPAPHRGCHFVYGNLRSTSSIASKSQQRLSTVWPSGSPAISGLPHAEGANLSFYGMSSAHPCKLDRYAPARCSMPLARLHYVQLAMCNDHVSNDHVTVQSWALPPAFESKSALSSH